MKPGLASKARSPGPGPSAARAPRAPRDTRYQSAYIFGAVCPGRGATAALVMPAANTEAMSAHLSEISKAVASGAHAILVMDGAGWHSAVPGHGYETARCAGYAAILTPVAASGSRAFCSALI